MKIASTIARYLAGVIFLVFGLNGFLNFIPLPPPAGIAGQFMAALYISHYLWMIFAFQLIAGILLLVNRYVPLALAMLAPVIVNILLRSQQGRASRRRRDRSNCGRDSCYSPGFSIPANCRARGSRR